MSSQLPSGTELAAFYQADLAEQDLISECKYFKHHIYCWRQNTVPHPTVYEMYSLIKADSLESTFPYIEIALQIYLTMMPTNCIGERSFSKLKIVKNHLRSCIQPRHFFGCAYSQDTSLAVMSIESDILENIDFSDIVRALPKTIAQEILLVGNKFSILLLKHVECR